MKGTRRTRKISRKHSGGQLFGSPTTTRKPMPIETPPVYRMLESSPDTTSSSVMPATSTKMGSTGSSLPSTTRGSTGSSLPSTTRGSTGSSLGSATTTRRATTTLRPFTTTRGSTISSLPNPTTRGSTISSLPNPTTTGKQYQITAETIVNHMKTYNITLEQVIAAYKASPPPPKK